MENTLNYFLYKMEERWPYEWPTNTYSLSRNVFTVKYSFSVTKIIWIKDMTNEYRYLLDTSSLKGLDLVKTEQIVHRS